VVQEEQEAIQSYKLINKLINKFRWSSSKFINN